MTDTVKKIKAITKAQGLKQADLSVISGHSTQAISSWFNDARTPNIAAVEDLVDALGLELRICKKRGVNA